MGDDYRPPAMLGRWRLFHSLCRRTDKRMNPTSSKPNRIVGLCPIARVRLINLSRRIRDQVMRHRFVAALTASASFAMLLTSVQLSLADVIDGEWGRADGKRRRVR